MMKMYIYIFFPFTVQILDRVHNQGQELLAAMHAVLVQFIYTYLFGIYATLILLRTDSIYPAIIAHSLVNYFGLPVPQLLGILRSPYSKFWLTATLTGVVAFLYFCTVL